jgi:hypothetical protein
MTATVQIGQKTGTGGTFTDKTSGTIRLKNAGDANADLQDPLLVPTGTGVVDWSFECWLRLKCTAAPSAQLSNPQFYTDGTGGFGTGVTTYAKKVAAYATPAEATATGTGWTNIFDFTPSAPLTLGSAVSQTGTGEFGDHLVIKAKVDSSAIPGVRTAEVLTFSYDEI